MEIPARLIDFLNENKVRYEVIRHEEAFTAQELAEFEQVKGRNHAKSVMVTGGAQQLMAVLPADRQIDLEKLGEIVGKSVSISTEEQFRHLFPDCRLGAMSPFGVLYNVPTYVDKSLTYDEFLVFEAGTRTHSIKMTYDDFARLGKAQVADFGLKHHSPPGGETRHPVEDYTATHPAHKLKTA